MAIYRSLDQDIEHLNPRVRQLHSNEAYFNSFDRCWDVLRSCFAKLSLDSSWTSQFSERSMTIKNTKLGCSVKVTCGGEVFLDHKVGKFDFKSEKYQFVDIQQASDKLTEIVGRFQNKKSVKKKLQ